MTPEETERFLTESLTLRLCTHNRDGTIQAAPVWYKYEDQKIFIGTPIKSRKALNIRSDSRLTALIDDYGPPTRGVIIY